jgi:hypothetical protein
MAIFTIKLEGIGLIYEKENVWKVLFPFNRQHRVNFIWKGEGKTNNESL